jgi:hypothetical protein
MKTCLKKDDEPKKIVLGQIEKGKVTKMKKYNIKSKRQEVER